MYTYRMNVHFICRGNVLRSLIAETYLRSLGLKNLNVISSGTNVDWTNPTEREYFSNTLSVLNRHNIQVHVMKDHAEQLDQDRIDNNDLTVCMNQRVVDEVGATVKPPKNLINWDIVDIGEGHRIIERDRELYEEEIYQEITRKVNGLVSLYDLSKYN